MTQEHSRRGGLEPDTSERLYTADDLAVLHRVPAPPRGPAADAAPRRPPDRPDAAAADRARSPGRPPRRRPARRQPGSTGRAAGPGSTGSARPDAGRRSPKYAGS